MNIHLLHPTRNRKPETPSFKPDVDHCDPEQTLYLKEYGRIKLRPIRADDEPRMIRFHENLSEESIYLRYFEHISLDTRTLHERLAKVCANSPDSYAIVAERHETSHRPGDILAVGRLTTTEDPAAASFAMLMSDKVQDTELPRHLLNELIRIARVHGFRTLTGELLVADHDPLNLCRSAGFSLRTLADDGLVRVSRTLS